MTSHRQNSRGLCFDSLKDKRFTSAPKRPDSVGFHPDCYSILKFDLHFRYNFLFDDGYVYYIHYSLLLRMQWNSCWAVRGSSPGEGEIFWTGPDRSWDQPSLLYNRFQFAFPGLNRSRRDLNHPPSFSTEVKEEVELLPLLLVLAWMACSGVNFSFTFIVWGMWRPRFFQ
jgi:hypothetical protein